MMVAHSMTLIKHLEEWILLYKKYDSVRLSLKYSKNLIGETTTKNNGKNVNGLITLRQKQVIWTEC